MVLLMVSTKPTIITFCCFGNSKILVRICSWSSTRSSFLPDLVEQPEVTVGTQSDQSAHFVAGILHLVQLSDLYPDWLLLVQSLDLDFDLLGLVPPFPHFFEVLVVVEEIPAEFDFRCAEDGESFLLFLLGEVGASEPTYSDTLPKTDPLLVGGACESRKSCWEGRGNQGRIWDLP